MDAQLTGYHVGESVRRTRTTSTHVGVREEDGLPVVLRFHDIPQDEAGRLEHEYQVLRDLEVAGIARAVDFLRSGSRYVIVYERPSGVDLKQYSMDHLVDLAAFLRIATRTVGILAEVHAHAVIHRNITPTSILVDPGTLEVCLADFGITPVMQREHRRIYDPQILATVLPYVSPEQTGRTGHSVDLRTDLYSVGVVFYELLAGRLPFEATDPVHLVHSHLSVEPESIRSISLTAPEVLSDIVERLLAKDPADRYQSAGGLLDDLERCQTSRRGDIIQSFGIGATDVPEGLQFPTRLYGRETEAKRLADAFERARAGAAQFVLISGEAGTGKTVLANQLRRTAMGAGGWFVAGKSESQRREVPFLALGLALDELAALLLIENEERLARWTRLILATVGLLCRVLTDLSEKFEEVLGPQPALPQLEVTASRNRLMVAVTRLLSVLASVDHPLVLFFDDLQWSDPGSVELLVHLAGEVRTGGLLVIGAYRAEELTERHPLSVFGRRLDAVGRKPTEVTLAGLSGEATKAFVRDVLDAPSEAVQDLVLFLAKRTDGNPQTVRQLLQFPDDQGLLVLGKHASWSWDDRTIRRGGIPEDAATVVQLKVGRVPVEERRILAAASCMGYRFDVASLAEALQSSVALVLPRLAWLCEEGFLSETDGGYRFSHDRIEDASRRWVRAEEEGVFHERIGRYRLRTIPREKRAQRAFDIVDHLNWCNPAGEDAQFALDLARLNHGAGTLSLRSGVADSAEQYLTRGIAVLGCIGSARSDGDARELHLSLSIDRVRAIAWQGRHEEADQIFDVLLSDVRDSLEVARVCLARVGVLAAQSRHGEAVRWGIHGLRRSGLPIPGRPGILGLLSVLLYLKLRVRGDVRARILSLPDCTDPHALSRLALLREVAVSAYYQDSALGAIIMVAQLLHVLRHGVSGMAWRPIAFGASIVGSVLGDPRRAELVAKAPEEMESQEPVAMQDGGYVQTRTSLVLPRTRPYRETVGGFSYGYERSLEQGDFYQAGTGIANDAVMHYMMGADLETVSHRSDRALERNRSWSMHEVAHIIDGLARLCSVLIGREYAERVPSELLRLGAREAHMCELVRDAWDLLQWMWLGRFPAAYAVYKKMGSEYERLFFSLPFVSEVVLAGGLAAACCHANGGQGTRETRTVVLRCRRKQARWAESCEANFAHKWLLLEAELARIAGKNDRALRLYGEAAQSAQRHGFQHMQALILERLGRLGQGMGIEHLAEASLGKARELYLVWGAEAKARQLGEEISRLYGTPDASGHDDDGADSSDFIDLRSVLQASQTISTEVDLGKLLRKFVEVIVENVGAQRGFLVLERSGGFHIEAAVDPESAGGDVSRPAPVKSDLLSEGVVRYVARTGELLVMADASQEQVFSQDPYVLRRRPKSVLCMPVTRKGKRYGVLYLENNHMRSAFTKNRIEVLEMLLAQAAISIENSRAYEELKGEIHRRGVTEQALREESRLNGLLLDSLPCPAMLVRRDRTVMAGNRFAREAGARVGGGCRWGVGRGPVFIPGAESGQAVVAKDTSDGTGLCSSCRVDEALAGQEPKVVRDVAVSDRTWDVYWIPVDEDTCLHYAVDISERRRVEEEVREQRQELMQADKLTTLGIMVSSVAHEVQNPNNQILVNAAVLKEVFETAHPIIERYCKEMGDVLVAGFGYRELRAEVSRLFSGLIGGSERIGTIIGDLKGFAGKEQSGDRESVNIPELIRFSAGLLRGLVEKSTEHFSVEAEDVPQIPGTRRRLEQVFVNLIQNACQALHGVQDRVVVSTRYDRENARIVVEVRDEGVGIPAALIGEITKPFVTTKGDAGGIGLGLSVCSRIIEEHGGKLGFSSELDRGTTVTVSLPAALDEVYA